MKNSNKKTGEPTHGGVHGTNGLSCNQMQSELLNTSVETSEANPSGDLILLEDSLFGLQKHKLRLDTCEYSR